MHMRNIKQNLASLVTLALLSQPAIPLSSQQAPQPPQPPAPATQARIRVTTELVLVNVVAHDKKGNLVRDLKKEDFTLLEDGKKQEISTFDFQNVDQPLTAGAAEATVSGAAGEGTLLRAGKKAAPSLDARDRRLKIGRAHV